MSTETRTTSSTGGQKGVKEERFDLIPIGALTALARHYGVGARKYDDNQWRKGYEWSKSYAAMQRHLTAWWGGENTDEETGSSHIAAAAWHCFTLLTFIEEYPEFDDRYKTPNFWEQPDFEPLTTDDEKYSGAEFTLQKRSFPVSVPFEAFETEVNTDLGERLRALMDETLKEKAEALDDDLERLMRSPFLTQGMYVMSPTDGTYYLYNGGEH